MQELKQIRVLLDKNWQHPGDGDSLSPTTGPLELDHIATLDALQMLGMHDLSGQKLTAVYSIFGEMKDLDWISETYGPHAAEVAERHRARNGRAFRPGDFVELIYTETIFTITRRYQAGGVGYVLTETRRQLTADPGTQIEMF